MGCLGTHVTTALFVEKIRGKQIEDRYTNISPYSLDELNQLR
jgi:hypothetical protein